MTRKADTLALGLLFALAVLVAFAAIGYHPG